MSEEKNNNGSSKNILVADGNGTITDMIKEYLKESYQLLETKTGKETLSITEKYYPCDSHCTNESDNEENVLPEYNKSCEKRDLSMVILGTEFPDSTGLELIKNLRKKYHKYCLPIILCTPDNDYNTIMEALENGVSDYMVTPFTKDLLASKIDKMGYRYTDEEVERAEVIAGVPFFNGVPAAEVAYIFRKCSETIYLEPGETVCDQDDENYDIYILEEGKCDVFFNRKKVADLIAVDTVGEMGFIEKKKRSATVLATEPVKIIVLKEGPLEVFLNEERAISERIGRNIIFSLNERIKRSNTLIQGLKSMAEDFFRH